jgi:hypothetical protein
MQATDKFTITLDMQQWQQVIDVLADGRFRLVMPLIQEIQRQFGAAGSPTPGAAKGNGADEARTGTP